MVPDSGEPSNTAAADPTRPDPGFDEVAMYRVVRKAVEDAILGAVGTILLVGVAFVLVGTGASIAIQAGGWTGVAIGAAVTLFGLYLAGATLELIPPVREWF
jgi:hypothetical protein